MSRRSRTLAALWGVVLLEVLSPVPAVLSLGTAWVLLARPPWFLRLVEAVYGADAGAPADGDSPTAPGGS